MQKELDEPVLDITLSYTDVELILTTLEHYVPRTTLAKDANAMELIALFKQNESKLFRAMKAYVHVRHKLMKGQHNG